MPSCKVSGWDPALCGVLVLYSPCHVLSLCSLLAGGMGGGHWALVLSLGLSSLEVCLSGCWGLEEAELLMNLSVAACTLRFPEASLA